ncbi:MAG: AMMECR1 domain-containing protein [Thermoplasmataceae archaeon]|jgi:AMMECR1 domain-containing protein
MAMTQEKMEYSFLSDLLSLDGKKLKEMAFSAIKSKMLGMNYMPRIDDSRLKERAGIFVSLKVYGEHFSRAGTVFPSKPIWVSVIEYAIEAAFHSSMHQAISRDELSALEIGIYVIGQLQSINPLELGKAISNRSDMDGFLLTSYNGSVVALPNFEEEFRQEPQEYLNDLLENAGLSIGDITNSTVKVHRFRAAIF